VIYQNYHSLSRIKWTELHFFLAILFHRPHEACRGLFRARFEAERHSFLAADDPGQRILKNFSVSVVRQSKNFGWSVGGPARESDIEEYFVPKRSSKGGMKQPSEISQQLSRPRTKARLGQTPLSVKKSLHQGRIEYWALHSREESLEGQNHA
jgi:hypothetical protein